MRIGKPTLQDKEWEKKQGNMESMKRAQTCISSRGYSED